MGIGVGLFLMAVGAILAFAVTAEVQGIDVATVGWILMILGAVGILLSLVLWSSRGWGTRRQIVEEEPGLVSGRRTIIEQRDDII